MFEQVVSSPRWTIVHFVFAEIQGGEREWGGGESGGGSGSRVTSTKGQEVQV